MDLGYFSVQGPYIESGLKNSEPTVIRVALSGYLMSSFTQKAPPFPRGCEPDGLGRCCGATLCLKMPAACDLMLSSFTNARATWFYVKTC